MELQKELTLTRRVSWGSIIAGIFTVMAISLLLSTLGTSLGMAMLSPKSDDMVNGADTAVIVWTLVALLVSLACGGFITGRLAGVDGAIHGFLVWATSLIAAAVLGFAALGGVLNVAGSAVSSVASATGSVVSGVGSAAGQGAKGAFNLGEKVFGQLGIDTHLQDENLDQQVAEALRKSNIDTLQPDYLRGQLEGAGKETATAIKDLAVNPENSDAIIDGLVAKLKARSEAIGQGVDKAQLKQALAQNTSLTPEEADKAVENIIAARDKTAQVVTQRLNELQANIEQAKQRYAQLKQEAKEKADAAAKAVAKISLWSFFGLLLGAIVTSLSGLWGVNTHPEVKRLRA
ncbi:CAP-Gly protein [Pantoea sp. 1.19]|uniref:CAP-Gly protein n=1 Tax=Pantoea sp. 1.19 TaxID=1925589 RepID=UPI0009490B07|nr:CAP-Gly protein [Pantoea sp. 1.19]